MRIILFYLSLLFSLSPCIKLLWNHSGSVIRERNTSFNANPKISWFLWIQILPWAAWAYCTLLTPCSLCPQAHAHSPVVLASCALQTWVLVLFLCWIFQMWKSHGSRWHRTLGGNTPGATNPWTVPWSLPLLLQFIRNKLISCWSKWVLLVLQITFVVCQWEYECGMELRRTLDLEGGHSRLCEEWIWFPMRNSTIKMSSSEAPRKPSGAMWKVCNFCCKSEPSRDQQGGNGPSRIKDTFSHAAVLLRVTLCCTHSSTQRAWIQPAFTGHLL